VQTERVLAEPDVEIASIMNRVGFFGIEPHATI